MSCLKGIATFRPFIEIMTCCSTISRGASNDSREGAPTTISNSGPLMTKKSMEMLISAKETATSSRDTMRKERSPLATVIFLFVGDALNERLSQKE